MPSDGFFLYLNSLLKVQCYFSIVLQPFAVERIEEPHCIFRLPSDPKPGEGQLEKLWGFYEGIHTLLFSGKPGCLIGKMLDAVATRFKASTIFCLNRCF